MILILKKNIVFKSGIDKETVKVVFNTLHISCKNNKLFCLNVNYDHRSKYYDLDCQLNKSSLTRNDSILNTKWFENIDKCDNSIKLSQPLAQMLLQDHISIEYDYYAKQFLQMFLKFARYSLTTRNSYYIGRHQNFFGDNMIHRVL